MKKILLFLLLVISLNASSQTQVKKHGLRFHINNPLKNPCYQKGGIIVPALTMGGAIFFGIKAIQYNRLHTEFDGHNIVQYRNTPNGYWVYSGTCAVATIGIMIEMRFEK